MEGGGAKYDEYGPWTGQRLCEWRMSYELYR
jgi:hypothetical protein